MKKTAVQEVQEIFEENKSSISDIYVKHGFSNIPANPLTAGMCYKMKPEIADDLAPYLVPDQYNNAAGDSKPEVRKQLAGGLLTFFGDMAKGIGSLMGSKQGAQMIAQGQIPGEPAQQPNKQPAKTAEAESKNKIFGLSYLQAGLIAGVLLLILILVLGNKGGKKAAPAPAA